jgi:hypothetical protein
MSYLGFSKRPGTDSQSAVVNGREADLWYLEASIDSGMYKNGFDDRATGK